MSCNFNGTVNITGGELYARSEGNGAVIGGGECTGTVNITGGNIMMEVNEETDKGKTAFIGHGNCGVFDAQNTETSGNSISTALFTLGCTNEGDSISFGGVYADTAKIASGKRFSDGTDIYDSNTQSDVLTALKNVKLTPVLQ